VLHTPEPFPDDCGGPFTPGDGDALVANVVDSIGLVTKFTYFRPAELTIEVPTPTGDDVPVIDIPLFFEATAYNVALAGTTTADFCVGRDPRELPTKFEYRFLNVAELSNTGTCGDLSHLDLKIWPFYRGFPGKVDGIAGVYFVVATVQTTAEFRGVVSVLPDPSQLIDYSNAAVDPTIKAACGGPLPWRPLNLAFSVPAFGDFPNVEGNKGKNSTVQCDPPGSLTRRTTHVYPARLDAKIGKFEGKVFDEAAHLLLQISGLAQTIEEIKQCSPSSLPAVNAMRAYLAAATLKILARRYDNAISLLEQIAFVANPVTPNTPKFPGCPLNANYEGETIGRALGLSFSVHDRLKFANPANWDVYLIPAELEVPLLLSDAID
jgi:hypothetical protein